MRWFEDRLKEWSDWARGNQLSKPQGNVLADMMRIAAGEVPGRDLDVPYDLTFAIEATDKAVARLRDQNPKYRRIIMRYWMGHLPIFEIARELRSSEERARELLTRAESQVGRNIIMIEEGLTPERFRRKIENDFSRESCARNKRT